MAQPRGKRTSVRGFERTWGHESGENLTRQLGREWMAALPRLAEHWVLHEWRARQWPAATLDRDIADILVAIATEPLCLRVDHAYVHWFAASSPLALWARVPLRHCSPLVCHLLFYLLRLHAFRGRVNARTYEVSYSGFHFNAVLEQMLSRAVVLHNVCNAVGALCPSKAAAFQSVLRSSTALASHAAATGRAGNTLRRLAKNVAR
jgi:hypothetical protein